MREGEGEKKVRTETEILRKGSKHSHKQNDPSTLQIKVTFDYTLFTLERERKRERQTDRQK